jgi:hypothetical protein
MGEDYGGVQGLTKGYGAKGRRRTKHLFSATCIGIIWLKN